MYWFQVAALGAEALVMAALVLGLFRSRSLLGLSPLYIVIGGFQYLEASLSLRVEVAPGWPLYPASTVMFTATLLAVLLVYIKEETLEARKLVYGLVLANIGLSLIAMIVSEHVAVPGSAGGDGLTSALQGNAWVALVGTVLLYFDALGIILVYEFVSRYTRVLFVRAAAALIVVGAFDSVFFTLAVQWGRPDLVPLMMTAIAGKTCAMLLYAGALTLYLRRFEPESVEVGSGDVGDVFQTLTYRQRYEQARLRMTRDALTGLYNRGYFDEALPGAVAHAARYQQPLSVLLVDTDHFKEINDTHGHMVGDRVLKLVAEMLGEHGRAADTVCRYGGDEFVVILPNADATSAAAFAERFRRRLRERASVALAGGAVGITATVGIATFLEDSGVSNPEELLRLADNRLYMGKRAGRDRVVFRDLPAEVL